MDEQKRAMDSAREIMATYLQDLPEEHHLIVLMCLAMAHTRGATMALEIIEALDLAHAATPMEKH